MLIVCDLHTDSKNSVFRRKRTEYRQTEYQILTLLFGIPSLSLQRRQERYITIHVWKTLHKLAPNDIGIIFYEHIQLGTRCRIPPLKRTASALTKSIYDKSFAVMGPKLWNIIPQSITSAPSLESFKSRLTSYIRSTFPDLPPVPGYTTPNSNSLLDWKVGGLQQVV